MGNPLNHTKFAILKIWEDFKKGAFWCNLATQILSITYLIYALCAPSGLWYVNAALLTLSVSYFVFFLWVTNREISKTIKKRITTAYRWAKRTMKLVTIGITVYGLFLAADNLTPLALILPTFTIVSWALGLLIELICIIIESRLDYVFEGLSEDLGKIPVLGKWVKDFTGKDGTGEPSKNLLYLRNEVAVSEEIKKEEEKTQKEKKREERLKKWSRFFSKK